MFKNYPYVGSHYFSENFKPQDLSIQLETLRHTEATSFGNEVEFIFIVSGSAQIEINGRVFSLTKGDLIHLLPYHIHRFLLEKSETITFYRLRFSLGLLLLSAVNEQAYRSSLENFDYTVSIIHLNDRKEKHLLLFCEEVLYEKKQVNKPFENLHVALVSYIVYLFQTISLKAYVQEPPALEWQCLEYLQLYHQDPLTLASVSEKLSLTQEDVQVSLEKLTGYTFSQLLNQVRIRNATALLQFPDLTVQKIGSICGYQSNANFYKQFKSVHQMTPIQYRHHLKEHNQLVAYSDAWDIAIYILENCRSPLTLTNLTKRTNFSADKINHLLKGTFNLTFQELLNQCRIQIGRLLLFNFEDDLSTLAYKVGFSDANTFIRHYKEAFHQTPHQDKLHYIKNKPTPSN